MKSKKDPTLANMNYKKLKQSFSDTPKDYGLVPFWYWNGDMREQEIVRQLKLMKAAHINQVMIYPRQGLELPYLSKIFFERCGFAIKEAKSLSMKIWLYDEFNWPSGYCGGLIPEQYPEYLMKSLRYYSYYSKTGKFAIQIPEGKLITTIAVNSKSAERVKLRQYVQNDFLLWEGKGKNWQIFIMVEATVQTILPAAKGTPWSNGLGGYLDVLNPQAVAKYIELTHNIYYQYVGEDFGNTVCGFVTDEPAVIYDTHIKGQNATFESCDDFDKTYSNSLAYSNEPNIYGYYWSIPWTKNLLKIFQDRNGYDLKKRLLELADNDQIRNQNLTNDYWTLISDLFNESFCEQISNWCSRRNVAFTGHFCEAFGSDTARRNGDLFRSMRTQQIPGIDWLGLQKTYDKLLEVKAAVGAARTTGAHRVSCETYALGQWTCQLSDKIRGNNQLAVMGVNLNFSTDFPYSCKSIRKCHHNPIGFYQTPYWSYQKLFSDNVARSNFMASVGKPDTHIVLIVPTAQSIADAARKSTKSLSVEADNFCLVERLSQLQIDCDVINDSALSLCKVNQGMLDFSSIAYDTVILKGVRILSRKNIKDLISFAYNGGSLIILDQLILMTPGGEVVSQYFEDIFKKNLRMLDKENRPCEVEYGSGRVIFVPEGKEIIVSAEEKGKGKLKAFDSDPSSAWAAKSDSLPQFIALDFFDKTNIIECKIIWEKSDIKYTYEIQISDTGENWCTIKKISSKGVAQSVNLDNVSSRYIRIFITAVENKQWAAIKALDITVMNSNGNKKVWRPKEDQGKIISQLVKTTQPIVFYEKNGKLCKQLFVTQRKLADAKIFMVMNRSFKEIEIKACFAKNLSLELWDQADGKVYPIRKNKQQLDLSFAPKELRMLILRKKQKISSKSILLSRKRKTIRKITRPWLFKIARPNALPFTRVEMANPEFPDKWYIGDGLSIPEMLQKCPVLLVRSDFKIDYFAQDMALVIESGIVQNIRINGRSVSAVPRQTSYFDESSRKLSIAKLLQKGHNVFECEFFPPMYERNLTTDHMKDITRPYFDTWLIGNFSVKNNTIVKPVSLLNNGAWEKQGYPFYSGTGIYRVNVPLHCSDLKILIEIDVYQGVVEVLVNGHKAGVCICEPYILDITKFVIDGQNKIELHVTNTIANFLSHHKKFINSEPKSGLRTVKLVSLIL